MWVKIKNNNDCRECLQNYSRRKVELVFEYLVFSCDDYFIYEVLMNYGYAFTKYQHLSLISRMLEYDNKYFDCLGNTMLSLEERLLIFNKFVNDGNFSNEEVFEKIEKLTCNSFIFIEEELIIVICWLIKSQQHKSLKLIYDEVNLPKYLSNMVEPILIMEKLTEE